MVRISVLNDTLKVGDYECTSCELHATRRRKWSRRLAVPRAFVSAVDFFFVFSPPFALFCALCGTERGGRRGLSRDVFNAFDEGRLRRDDRLQRRQRQRLALKVHSSPSSREVLLNAHQSVDVSSLSRVNFVLTQPLSFSLSSSLRRRCTTPKSVESVRY